MALVHLVRDLMRLDEFGPYSAPGRAETMEGTRYTNARRTQRRDVREQRVHARAPSVRLDWRCPICMEWYSRYRGRNTIHLQHCERKQAEQIVREERRRAQTPLPSPDSFGTAPHSTPGQTSIPRSPTRKASIIGSDAQWDQDPEDVPREPLVLLEGGLASLNEDIPREPPVPDGGLAGGEDPGESGIAFQRLYHIHSHIIV